MNDRKRPAGLASLAVLFFFTAKLASAAEVECDVPFLDPRQDKFVLAPSSEDCSAAMKVLPQFKALLRAAGIEEEAVRLYIRLDMQINGYYHYGQDFATLNLGTLRDNPGPGPGVTFVLAHEVGHAVQDRGGQLQWSYAGSDSQESGRRSRIREAQADEIAADLMRKAGLDAPGVGIRGAEKILSCKKIQSDAPGDTHPAERDRFLHQLKRAVYSGQAVSDLKGRGAMDEAGLSDLFDRSRDRQSVAPASEPVGQAYRPRLNVDDFDAFGRPKTQGLRTGGVPGPGTMAAKTVAGILVTAPMGGMGGLFRKEAPNPEGFWGRMADSVGSAGSRAADFVMDFLWFDNPLIEAAAVNACGIVKDGDFNKAAGVGALAWVESNAVAAVRKVKTLQSHLSGETVDVAFRVRAR